MSENSSVGLLLHRRNAKTPPADLRPIFANANDFIMFSQPKPVPVSCSFGSFLTVFSCPVLQQVLQKARVRLKTKKHGSDMGTIFHRRRGDGSIGWTAQIVRKRARAVRWSEAKTFDTKQAAQQWMRRREAELDQKPNIKHTDDPPLSAVIDRYIIEAESKIGRTKAQVLRKIQSMPIASMPCTKITSETLVTFTRSLEAGPSTRQNYLSHLGAVFAIAKPAWGYALDHQAVKDAFTVTRRLGITEKAKSRTRRPTLDELDRLLAYFVERKKTAPQAMPMDRVILFALFSTRRQEEITRIRWADLDGDRVLVRDMKHPGQKMGNDVFCELVPEAQAVINSMSRLKEEIFPFSTDAISANFTRACKFLGIEDLHFHDLRHEGISRLFEMGRTIPQTASVSGHKSWTSLQRYAHIRQTGDKYAGWHWLSHKSLQN
jgi:integrase